MPGLEQFSRVQDPDHDLLEDGDLSPFVCESCRNRMASGPHWDENRFVNPREKLVTDGGEMHESSSVTERPGALERFAVDMALYAAWTTQLWLPNDREYGFTDYFEVAATRNLTLLGSFEKLAEDMESRGILPGVDSGQATLVTDGGQDTHGNDRLDGGSK